MATSPDRDSSSTDASKLEVMLAPRQQRAFGIAKHAAKTVLRRRLRVVGLVRRAYTKLSTNEDAVAQIKEDLGTLLRLAKTWATREYRAVPWRSVVYAVAAIVYFLNPADLIPDALIGIGFVDDVAVVTAVVSAIQRDLLRFRSWEAGQLTDGHELDSPS